MATAEDYQRKVDHHNRMAVHYARQAEEVRQQGRSQTTQAHYLAHASEVQLERRDHHMELMHTHFPDTSPTQGS